ncbi:hypothetical protein ACROYT_G010376 [Oculina patagonica]
MAAGPAATDHGDGSYSLEEEIELLEAIYIHELTLEGPRERPIAVSVLLHPSTGDEEHKRFVCLTLVIDLPDKYPSELPSIHIKTPRGLSEAHIESILANLRELAEGCLGRPMLYELIEYAKESLTDNNTPSCACAICLCHFQDNHEFTKTECYHYFHCGCLARYIEFSLQLEKETEDSTKVECPMCRLPITYNLTELKTVASSEGNEEEVAYKPSVEIRKLQKKMSSMFDKQKRKGGVIDVEQERNRYLIDITSVRQEETVPESEPPTGPETDTVTKNPTTEHTVNVPKAVDAVKAISQPDDISRKDKQVKSDKKEFSKYSGPSRSPGRPIDKTGNRWGEEKFKQNGPRRTEKKRPTTTDRPKSTEQTEKEKQSAKEPDKQESDFAIRAEAKPDSAPTGLKSEKNTSVVDPQGKVERGVPSSSNNSSSSHNFNTERPRTGRRGRGRSGRGRPPPGSANESRDGEKKEKEKESAREPDKQESDFAIRGEAEPDSAQTELKSEKNTSVVDPPEKVERSVSGGSNNSNSRQNYNGERPRSGRRGRGRLERGRPPPGRVNEPLDGAKDMNKSGTSSREAVKRSDVAGPSENRKPPLEKNGDPQDQGNSVQKNPTNEGGLSSKNKKVCKPPPGFTNLKTDEGGCEQSTNANSRPPPGFEQHSTRPRPPPGLGNLAEGEGQNTSQSLAS